MKRTENIQTNNEENVGRFIVLDFKLSIKLLFK
jgi:hypothetical protein